MQAVVKAVVTGLASIVRSRLALQIEILALRHQLAVYQRAGRRPRLVPADRLLWAWLSRAWSGWREALVIVQPRTVIAWQRKRFRDYWTRLSRHGQRGCPPVAQEVRDLIRKMSAANPTWGSPRIMGELRKLGIEVAKSTVAKYRVRPSKPPSPTWRAFLANHAKDLASIDFFTVATVRFEILFVLIILAYDRRRVRHFNITAHPTAEWTAQQVVEAFPWETAPRYLLRDRDGVYGAAFRQRVAGLGIQEVLSAPRSPWQSPPRRTGDREHPARVSGQCRGPAPAPPPSPPHGILRALPSLALSPGARHGLPGAAPDPITRAGRRGRGQ
jgi:putative transposase